MQGFEAVYTFSTFRGLLETMSPEQYERRKQQSTFARVFQRFLKSHPDMTLSQFNYYYNEKDNNDAKDLITALNAHAIPDELAGSG